MKNLNCDPHWAVREIGEAIFWSFWPFWGDFLFSFLNFQAILSATKWSLFADVRSRYGGTVNLAIWILDGTLGYCVLIWKCVGVVWESVEVGGRWYGGMRMFDIWVFDIAWLESGLIWNMNQKKNINRFSSSLDLLHRDSHARVLFWVDRAWPPPEKSWEDFCLLNFFEKLCGFFSVSKNKNQNIRKTCLKLRWR